MNQKSAATAQTESEFDQALQAALEDVALDAALLQPSKPACGTIGKICL